MALTEPLMSSRRLEVRANKQAEAFVDAYYSTYDSPSRNSKLPDLYRPDARVVWNGNALSGPTALKNILLSHLAHTKHEIQSFDAHVIPGSVVPPSTLPTISITVSGQLIFSSCPFPPTFSMPDPKDISPHQNPADAQEALNGLPRVFSQTFILAPNDHITESGSTPIVSNYSIIADCFRFVG